MIGPHIRYLQIFRRYGELLKRASASDSASPTLPLELERWKSTEKRLKAMTHFRLVSNNFICIHQEIQDFFGTKPSSAKAAFESRYPEHAAVPFDPSPELAELLENLRLMSVSSRKASWVSRVSAEAEEANDNGWYMIFDTLTVNRDIACPYKVFANGMEFSKYIQRVEEVVRQACGYSQAHRGGPPRRSYARHFCRFEQGTEGRNPHGHVVWFLQDVPEEWKVDPNLKLHDPRKQEIEGMKQMWPWGFSTPKAVRCRGDVWSDKHRWKWPIKQDGSRLALNGPDVCGRYVAKYLSKGDCELKWTQRVKATRGLGLSRLRQALKMLSTRLLRGLACPSLPMHQATQHLFRIPYNLSLLRKEALLERASRCLAGRTSQMVSLILNQQNNATLLGWQDGLQTNPRPWLIGSSFFVEWMLKCRGTRTIVSGERENAAFKAIADILGTIRQVPGVAIAGVRR